jgi:hypothetical protein
MKCCGDPGDCMCDSPTRDTDDSVFVVGDEETPEEADENLPDM